MANQVFTLDIVSDYAEVRRLGDWLDAIGRGRLDTSLLDELQLVAAEAANNIIHHAYSEKPGQPISVRLECAPDSIELLFRDNGAAAPPGFPDAQAASLDLDPSDIAALSESGRGLAIIRGCVDRIHYARNGTTNELRLTMLTRGTSP